MSDSWSDDDVRHLLGRLKDIEERRRNAEAMRGEIETGIAKIKSETRLKERCWWLVWLTNGDRSISDEYRSMRDELKLRKEQIAYFLHSRFAIIGQLDRVVAAVLAEDNEDYRNIVFGQREDRRMKEVFDDAVTVVRATRANLASESASPHVEPQGRAAVAAAKRKPGELSAQLAVSREKVRAVNNVVGSSDRLSSGLVNKLDITFLGAEFGVEQRKKQLDAAVRTLDEVIRRFEASRDKVAIHLRELEKSRARMVTDERNRLLSAHGRGT